MDNLSKCFLYQRLPESAAASMPYCHQALLKKSSCKPRNTILAIELTGTVDLSWRVIQSLNSNSEQPGDPFSMTRLVTMNKCQVCRQAATPVYFRPQKGGELNRSSIIHSVVEPSVDLMDSDVTTVACLKQMLQPAP